MQPPQPLLYFVLLLWQAALGLRHGCNTMEFVANVAGQSERVVTARVFLWSSGAKVVVSDIEGTIARR